MRQYVHICSFPHPNNANTKLLYLLSLSTTAKYRQGLICTTAHGQDWSLYCLTSMVLYTNECSVYFVVPEVLSKLQRQHRSAIFKIKAYFILMLNLISFPFFTLKIFKKCSKNSLMYLSFTIEQVPFYSKKLMFLINVSEKSFILHSILIKIKPS